MIALAGFLIVLAAGVVGEVVRRSIAR